MKYYEVGVAHKGIGLMWIFTISAVSKHQAKYKALRQAYNNKYTQPNATYTIDFVRRKK